ncbi:hypothetical protein [Paenibacillus methanolicus]|uniref:Peptidase YpeB-like protein n=1 Tax=Paenibacillus methanolicus TaxID=582686 RepID=A0A5S5BLT3_9BACL|nr:hypothetical protein [Paenibacillus methanolicus]TYP67368.1 hypothetical protein BCM02_1264 [Paenibacillus methanolicus]
MRHMRIIAIAAALTIITSAPSSVQAVSPVTVESSSNSDKVYVDPEIDSVVKNQVMAAVKANSDQEPQIEYNVVRHDEREVIVEGKLKGLTARYSVTYDKINKRVAHTTIYYNDSEMTQVMDAALVDKIANFSESFSEMKHPFTFDTLWRVNSPYQDNKPSNYWVFFGHDQSLYVDLDQHNRLKAHITVPLKQLEPKLINMANNAFKQIKGHFPTAAAYASLNKEEAASGFTWYIYDRYDNNHVTIGAKTNKILEVVRHGADWTNEADFNKSFAKAKYTSSKAIAAAKPAVKSLFKLNLSGYSVKVKQNVYTFTKKGMPTIIGKINKKGEFFSMQAIPVNGVLE